ncbi:cardiolipin synthase [Caldalkalibacillus uzonensis]|uniref:Cardiolipin synthase n=1 Tax=Caldalkalibacillus uzonensis TaxID=353224 RepID=A0ABU0CSD2_9BACI|nr:cardiolipin synthase [Caldalkalibacillus uzonensis]
MEPFFPVTFPLLNHRLNFRNHRKIVVVDGEVGFVGGLNIGDEYLGKDPFFGHWRDTHLKVEGEAVRSLQMIFLLDWFYMTGEKLLYPPYLSPHLIDHDRQQEGGVQIIASGPDHEWEVIKKLYFAMITSAKEKVYISSPYFIPDEDILSALKVAALSGVQVKLILPSKPDHKIVFWATRSYFTELLEAGVEIYLYQKGFMHSKVVIVDEELASIGSANMDMRSFHLNFEVNAFLYRNHSVKRLVEDFRQDISDSQQVMLNRYRQRKFHHRLYESVARLFSPLL